MSMSSHPHRDRSLAGRRVLVVGRLASMSRREAEKLIRGAGGQCIEREGEPAEILVVSDELGELQRMTADPSLLNEFTRMAYDRGELAA